MERIFYRGEREDAKTRGEFRVSVYFCAFRQLRVYGLRVSKQRLILLPHDPGWIGTAPFRVLRSSASSVIKKTQCPNRALRSADHRLAAIMNPGGLLPHRHVLYANASVHCFQTGSSCR